jgi:WD40 repeat protein
MFPGAGSAAKNGATAEATQPDVPVSELLFEPAKIKPEEPAAAGTPSEGMVDRILIPECRLAVVNKEEVPTMHDGVILYLGTDLQKGEQAHPEWKFEPVAYGEGTVQMRPLKQGEFVQKGQLLAILDNRLPTDDFFIKRGKIAVANAEADAAAKTKDEAWQRWLTQERLKKQGRGATSDEDWRGAYLVYNKSSSEAVSKKEAVELAKLEWNQTKTALSMHEVRAAISGFIRTIYKYKGESVKNLEPILQIQNLDLLRAEGLVDIQYRYQLKPKMTAVVEAVRQKPPKLTLVGHLQEVTGVAWTGEKEPRIVSCSDDGTVRLWNRAQGLEGRILRPTNKATLDTGYRALACTPPGSEPNLCLAGSADGYVRIWNLNAKVDTPLFEEKTPHRVVTALAITPDGKHFATGGEDRQICLWDTNPCKMLYTFKGGHRGAITSLQFTPQAKLVSAGKDNTLHVWTVGKSAAHLESTKLDHRSGTVDMLGVSPDGQRVVFDDQGKILRILSLPQGLTRGVIFNPSGASNFSTFALFSPDSRLILTAGGGDSRLQLWRAPTGAGRRASEVRQFISPGAIFTCAAFSPDSTLVVTGSKDRHLQVWDVPSKEETDRQRTAKLTLVEQAAESTGSQVRVWAEFENLPGEDQLLPGATVTLVIDPSQKVEE